jgi:hypothetical protein
MTASHARNGTKTPSGSSGQSLVLYGLDERGKARAACFAAKEAALARKAVRATPISRQSPSDARIVESLALSVLLVTLQSLFKNQEATVLALQL